MKCPSCLTNNSIILDTRKVFRMWKVRRRRKCKSCGRKWTTIEERVRNDEKRKAV